VGEPPCNALQAELALDLVTGELAVELPAHVRAFARAHAGGRPPPAAPLVARLTSTLVTARDACIHDELRDRGLAVLRLVVPLVIEDDPAVAAARRAPVSWPGLVALARARDAATQARFQMTTVAMLHRLHGCVGEPAELPWPKPPIPGWTARDTPCDDAAIADVWQAVAARLGVTGTVRVDRGAADTRPRAFVVEPRREIIVVVPGCVDTPAARFAVLHELGHAAAGLALPGGLPRVVDEAAAGYVARLAETASFLPPRWHEPLAAAARARRVRVAAALDRVERALPAESDAAAIAAWPQPPWSLWHDPAAQAAYVAADAVAERIHHTLGPSPPRGQFVRALAAERDRVERETFA
jgi:hypothetical protein